MAVSSATDVFVGGDLIGVDVARIERELAQLWKDAAEVKEGDGRQAVMRSCVANLVVFLGDQAGADSSPPSTTERVSDTVSEVVTRHPCRVLLIATEARASGEPIKAWISARCQMPRNGKRLCCEQINLSAAQSAVSEIPGVVLPLLAPDIPVYLWWCPLVDFDSVLYRRLIENTDNLLFDSALIDEPRKHFPMLLREIGLRGESVAFRDLNWDRLTPWRQLTAQFFDSPSQHRFLPGISRARIDSGSDPNTVCRQGMLLAGWMATRLGWEFESMTDTPVPMVLRFREGRQIEIAMGRGTQPGLTAVELQANHGNQTAHFTIRRADDGISAVTTQQINDAEPMCRRVRMRVRAESRLLSDEMDVTGRDRVFEQSLAMAARILSGQYDG